MNPKIVRNKNEADQTILDCIPSILLVKAPLADRKANSRKIVEAIINDLFENKVSKEEFDKLNKERQRQIDENKVTKVNRHVQKYTNSFQHKTLYLIQEKQIIPQEFEYNFSFIWGEASRYGSHPSQESKGGLVPNMDIIMISLYHILDWYFYRYRNFAKASISVEEDFQKYFREHLPYLNKKTHKGFIITSIASGLLFISSCVFGILYFSEKQDFQKLQTEYTITSLQQEKTIKMFSDSLSKNKSAANISNGSVGGDLTFGDKVGGDKIGGDKVESKSIKYNAEKGNIYTIPSGDITINKSGK